MSVSQHLSVIDGRPDGPIPLRHLFEGVRRSGANPIGGEQAVETFLVGAFGPSQGARFTVSTDTPCAATLILKVSGGTLDSAATSIQVRYIPHVGASRVEIWAIDRDRSCGPLVKRFGERIPVALEKGDSLIATADERGLVSLLHDGEHGISCIGDAQLPERRPWTGGGRVGIRLSAGSNVDNFFGGALP